MSSRDSGNVIPQGNARVTAQEIESLSREEVEYMAARLLRHFRDRTAVTVGDKAVLTHLAIKLEAFSGR